MSRDETADRVEEYAARFIEAMLTHNSTDGFPVNQAVGVGQAIDLAKELVDQIHKRFRS